MPQTSCFVFYASINQFNLDEVFMEFINQLVVFTLGARLRIRYV